MKKFDLSDSYEEAKEALNSYYGVMQENNEGKKFKFLIRYASQIGHREERIYHMEFNTLEELDFFARDVKKNVKCKSAFAGFNNLIIDFPNRIITIYDDYME